MRRLSNAVMYCMVQFALHFMSEPFSSLIADTNRTVASSRPGSCKMCPTKKGVGVTRTLVRRFLGVGFVSMALCLVALTFALPQTAYAVVDSTTFEGIITDSVTGDPVADAEVYLLDADGTMLDFAFTTEGGAYAFYEWPVGTYTIEVNAENYEPYTKTGVVFSGTTVDPAISIVAYKVAFEGTITDSVTSNPITDVSIMAYDPASPEDSYYGYTGTDGTYEIFAPAGTYTLDVDAMSHEDTTVAGLAFDGSAAVTRNFSLVKYPLAFTGTITDSVTGLPIMDAAVYAYDEEGFPVGEAYSEDNGAYALYAPAGPLDLDVEAYKYHTVYEYGVAFDGVTSSDKDFALVPPSVTRAGGKNRYETAEQIARKGWDPDGDKSWTDVTDIIIANGEAGKEADPVTAAGLAGAYDAPLLLTQASVLPPSTKRVITEIALKNPSVQIHLIGGTSVVPDARWNNMKAIKGVSQLKHRVAGDDRYKTSVAIANAIIDVVGDDGLGGFILIAGDNPAAFYDGLAASPISYVNQMPMLSVKKGSVPDSVSKLLARPELKDYERFAASSSTYIGSVPARGATRMATSSNRYTASAQIAEFAVEYGMSGDQDVALASSLPDALTGGAFLGRRYGVLLFTDSSKGIQSSPKTFIEDYADSVLDGWVIGGTTVLPTSQETTFRNLIK